MSFVTFAALQRNNQICQHRGANNGYNKFGTHSTCPMNDWLAIKQHILCPVSSTYQQPVFERGGSRTRAGTYRRLGLLPDPKA